MNRKVNVVIVDDSITCINCLLNSLSFYSNISVTGISQNAENGKKVILQLRPDLLFLDVEMPGMNGLELLRNIRDQIDWPIQVIFYTAYDKYLLEALRESAFDYLLKPYTQDELSKVLERYSQYLKSEPDKSFNDALSRLLPTNKAFMISTYLGFQILNSEQIGYFKYLKEKKQWKVTLNNLKELYLKRNTNAKDILNYSSSFVQINRDQIININYLSRIQGKDCILFPPFNEVDDLTASSLFIGYLKEKYVQI